MEKTMLMLLLFYYVINRHWVTSKTSRHNPILNNDRSQDIKILRYLVRQRTGVSSLRKVKAWVERLKRPPTENTKILFNDTEGSK